MDQYIPLISYFAPEIELYYPQIITNFESRIDPFLRQNFDNLLPSETQFLLGFEQYRDNGWDLLNDRRLNTYEPSSLPHIIKSDDIDTFRMIVETTHFHFNQVIPHTVYTDTVYPFADPTILQFAAFHGSINIFTYLLSNEKCELDKTNPDGLTVAQFAVAGGHREIVNILKEKGVSFKHTLQSAAAFYQNDLFVELFFDHVQDLNDYDSTFDSVLNCCITQSNMELVLFCLENGYNINQKGKVSFLFILIITQYIAQSHIAQTISFRSFYHTKEST